MHKDVRRFRARLERSGYIVNVARSGHLRVTEPGGRFVMVVSVSPSDRYWLRNAERDIRKYGRLELED